MSTGDSNQLEIIERVVDGALALPDASLVIYRRGVLVEFKTERLSPRLTRALGGKYRAWRIGSFEGHHCHLDLASVDRAWFDAEPVSCQGGRLNYTVWFLAAGECGNPYRTDGLFAVTLNAPYHRDGTPRIDVISRVVRLFDQHAAPPVVSSSDRFNLARTQLELEMPD